MPRVNVQKANKNYPSEGIKKGETYYKWKFRYGPLVRSAIKPRRSQLTQSEFLGWLYDTQDGWDGRFLGCADQDDLDSAVEEAVSEIQEQIDELEEKMGNLPEQFQDAGPGEILQERIDGLDSWMSDLESVNTELDEGNELDDVIQEFCSLECDL